MILESSVCAYLNTVQHGYGPSAWVVDCTVLYHLVCIFWKSLLSINLIRSRSINICFAHEIEENGTLNLLGLFVLTNRFFYQYLQKTHHNRCSYPRLPDNSITNFDRSTNKKQFLCNYFHQQCFLYSHKVFQKTKN